MRNEVSGETQATEPWIILCNTPTPLSVGAETNAAAIFVIRGVTRGRFHAAVRKRFRGHSAMIP
jgi:hypothetical protein